MREEGGGPVLVRYEAALWSVFGATAYLARGDAELVYPDVLWLFAGLLAASLASSWTVRRWPGRALPHGLCVAASLALVAAIEARSGGARSNLWVLYLLPLFSSALLLTGRELALVAVGAALCDAALFATAGSYWGASALFELSVRTGILWGAAAATWLLAESERRARARAESRRAELDRVAAELRRSEDARGRGEALAAVGLACAATAHDMATPLMVIRGYARMRLEQPDLPEDLTSDFERIDQAAAFCQRMASATLSRARGASGAGETFSLLGAVEGALSISEEILRRRRIAVRRLYADDDFTARGESQEIERLFLNLVSNAVKAMPDGGTLTLRLRAIEADGGRQAEARVEDTGPGLPPEIVPRLFAPFSTSGAGRGGNGLGLHLSRETARRRGGDLTAANLPDGGACFTVRLRLEPAAVSAA